MIHAFTQNHLFLYPTNLQKICYKFTNHSLRSLSFISKRKRIMLKHKHNFPPQADQPRAEKIKQITKLGVFLILSVFAFLSYSYFTRAQVPDFVNYQGRLRDSSGNPITTPTTIQFSLYSHITNGAPTDVPSSAGPLLWTETYDGSNPNCQQITPGADGIFAQHLGDCVSFPAYLDFTQEYYLGVKIGSDNEATPRVPLSTHPYAFTSKRLYAENEDVYITTGTSGNIIIQPANDVLLYDTNASVGVAGEILSSTGSGIEWISPGSFSAGALWDTDHDTGVQVEKNADDDTLRIDTAGSQRMAIDNTGNLLLSDTEPISFINPGNLQGLLFRDDKFALRIGETNNNEWDDANIGRGSFASGRNNIVSGNYSVAFGGSNNVNDVYATALGRNNTVAGSYAVAGGYQNVAGGYASSVFGQTNQVTDRRAMAWGLDNIASQDEATAWGRNTRASANYATSWGRDTVASGELSTAFGYQNTASQDYGLAFGYQNTVSGRYATGWGGQNTVSGQYGTAWGSHNTASGAHSTAFGYYSEASGENATAIGDSLANSNYMTAIGRFNENVSGQSLTNWVDTDQLFVIGNGTGWQNANRSNALTVLKNGTITAPSFSLAEIDAAGDTALTTKEYVDNQLMWEILATGTGGMRIQPKDHSVRQIYVEENSNSYTQFMVRNNNDTGNGAGAIIELKGSGADYTNNMYIGKYGAGFWIPELQNQGAVLTDRNLVIGTASAAQEIHFVTGNSYSDLRPVVVADNEGFRYTSDLSATFVDRTLVDKAYVDSRVGNSIFDADADTGIQVEANPDEDMVRFSTAGTERFLIDNNGRMRLADNPTSFGRSALFEVGIGSESSTFAVSGDPAYLNIATFRDEDGENIFRAQGSLANDDLIVTFGDWDWAYDQLAFGLDAGDDALKLYGGAMRFYELGGAHADYIGFKAPNDVTTNTIWTLPGSDGLANYLLQTDGSGNLSWTNPAMINGVNIYNSDGSLIGNRIVTMGANNLQFDSAGQTGLLFLDSVNNRIGIGTNTPNNLFQVGGLINFDDLTSSTFLGKNAGINNTANYNTFIGFEAGQATTSGRQNVYIGYRAGTANTTGRNSVFIGESAGVMNDTGNANTFIGRKAGENNSSGNENTFIGKEAGRYNTTGGNNTGIGTQALKGNTTGGYNMSLGNNALQNSTNANRNIAIGFSALGGFDHTYNNNIVIGTEAGNLSGDLDGCVMIGDRVGISNTVSNRLMIDNSGTNTPLLDGYFDSDILRVNGTFQINDPTGTGYAFPATDGTNGQVLQTDGSGNLSWTSLSGGSGVTASNGLTKTGNDIRLGGALTQNTTVGSDTDNSYLIFRNYQNNIAFFSHKDSTNYSYLSIHSGVADFPHIAFRTYNNGDKYEILADSSLGGIITDDINHRGLQYYEDYSANYTDRTLVDKEYVDNQISPFDTTSNVTSNENDDYANDDFVFGSPSLANDGNDDHDRRFFFDKSKAAFRAGYTPGSEWDDANVGIGSIALGSGYVDGEGSITNAPIASGIRAIAIGIDAVASGTDSFATAGAEAVANTSFATTNGTANASGSVAMIGGTTNGIYSVAMGGTTTGEHAVSMGLGTTAGEYSVAMGYLSTASGQDSVAMGQNTSASKLGAVAMGLNSVASGSGAVALGKDVFAKSYGEVAFGLYNTDYVANNDVDFDPADRIFVIGNGTGPAAGDRSDALTVLKNGTITAPDFSIAEINTAGNTALVTKEYVDSLNTNLWDIDADTGIQVEESADEDMIRFDTAGSQRMRIDNNGLLSYGTEKTDYNLAYFGTQHSVFTVVQEPTAMATFTGIKYGDDAEPGRIAFLKARGSEGAETALQDGDEIAEFATGAYDGTRYMTTGGLIVKVDGVVGTDNVPSKLEFLTNTGNNLGSDVKMVLDHNGNLGIGDSVVPTSKLHVDTDSASTEAIMTLENVSGSTQIFRTGGTPEGAVPGSIGDIAFDGTNGEMYIKHSGNATTTGWLRALRQGDMISLWDADSDTGIQVEESADEDIIRFDIGDASGTAHQDAMVINSDGNVGIGTTSPSVKLQVSGQARASSFRSANGTAGSPSYRFDGDTNTGLFRAAADNLAFTTGGSEAMRIDANGNLGLGVTIPTYKMTIAGGALMLDSIATIPTASQGYAGIYTSNGELYAFDESANSTQISPHDKNGKWWYNSTNLQTGSTLQIKMEDLTKDLNKLLGGGYILENGVLVDKGQNVIEDLQQTVLTDKEVINDFRNILKNIDFDELENRIDDNENLIDEINDSIKNIIDEIKQLWEKATKNSDDIGELKKENDELKKELCKENNDYSWCDDKEDSEDESSNEEEQENQQPVVDEINEDASGVEADNNSSEMTEETTTEEQSTEVDNEQVVENQNDNNESSDNVAGN